MKKEKAVTTDRIMAELRRTDEEKPVGLDLYKSMVH